MAKKEKPLNKTFIFNKIDIVRHIISYQRGKSRSDLSIHFPNHSFFNLKKEERKLIKDISKELNEDDLTNIIKLSSDGQYILGM